jgi:hypothetical protein
MWHRTADAWMQEASRFQFVTGGVTDIENGDGIVADSEYDPVLVLPPTDLP